MEQLKQRKNIPVNIVEDHNEVVPHIHRNIGSKYLPLTDVTLVHFDSHPDMLIPLMQAEVVYDKEQLYITQSIENWILPLVYAGHVNNILWLKPPWCKQIEDKIIDFFVGKCPRTGTIRTSCKENYFISETLFVAEDELLEKKPVKFTVATVVPKNWDEITVDAARDNTCDNEPEQSGDIKRRKLSNNDSIRDKHSDSDFHSTLTDFAKTLGPKRYILDIDLDFYSTKNPFLEMYTAKQMSMLKKLYQFTAPADYSNEAIENCVIARKKQLSKLKDGITLLSTDSNAQTSFDEEELKLVQALVRDIKDADPSANFEMLHEAGCTMDDTELPHHVSSQQQICALVQETKDILKQLAPPTLITVSRSSADDYCPPDQVDYIEEAVTLALEEVFVYTNVFKHYADCEEGTSNVS